MKTVGTRSTYRIFAVLSLITGLVYLLFYQLYLKKRPQTEGNDIVKKEPKKPREIQESKVSDKERIAVEETQPSNALTYYVDDMEAINNAKNLDIIDCFEEDGDDDDVGPVRQRHVNGSVNPSFVPDEETGSQATPGVHHRSEGREH